MIQLSQSRDRHWNRERLCQSIKTGAFAFLLAIGCTASAQALKLAAQGNWQVDADVINKKPRCVIANNDYAVSPSLLFAGR